MRKGTGVIENYRSPSSPRYLSRAFLVGTSLLASTLPVAYAEGRIVRCAGWFGGERVVDPSRVNDGYCDCPRDGLDELGTGACAGSMDGGWAGIVSTDDDAVESQHFQCPQQESLRLPLSRVDDGICDCCDGADEPTQSGCKDSCDVVLAAERAARAKAQADFAFGSKRRREGMDLFAVLLKETVEKIEHLTKVEVPAVAMEIGKVDGEVRTAKLVFVKDRLRAAKFSDTLMDIVRSLSNEELVSLITSVCQLTGELLPGSTKNKSRATCTALRRAGLDMGFIWDDNELVDFTSELRIVDENDDGALLELAHLLEKNLGEGKQYASQNIDDDTERYDDMDEDSYDEYRMDDDDMLHDEQYDGSEENEGDTPSSRENEESEANENQKRILDAVRATPVSVLRAAFKSRAKSLMDTINSALGAAAPEKEDTEEGEAESVDESAGESPSTSGEEQDSTFDPMQYQMIRSTLSKRTSDISKGEDIAKSAAILLDSIVGSGKNDPDVVSGHLRRLALGSIYHSNISIEDIAELIYITHSALNDAGNSDEGECTPFVSSFCPPRVVTPLKGDGPSVSYPPPAIVAAAETRCNQRGSDPSVCFAKEASSSADIGIPSSVPDGYFNYYEPKERGEGDVLASYFTTLNGLQTVPVQLSELEQKKVGLEEKQRGYGRELQNLEEKIGGRTESKFGSDGELYLLRDSCHSLEEGKYEYEVCIFGKATQRDRGQKSGGTNLGKWNGMEFDEETGERKMKWTEGTACWNGPRRSAEVYVTCGADTKILTADEPDTCRYVMTMESPVACDDKFRERLGL